MKSLPRPKTGFVITHYLTVTNVERSTRFHRYLLGGEVVLAGEPTFVALANTYIVLNVGAGSTDDRPNITLRPPTSSTDVSSFLNFRVSDIQHYYQEWKGKGAEFLTEPKNHPNEFRCYMKDPDGYIIEVGEMKAEAFKHKA
ncbi:MAG: VOC family protein [Verrucomicrobia bacterium]|nr:VOC family protein [Verrucomicrobiota bacterium]